MHTIVLTKEQVFKICRLRIGGSCWSDCADAVGIPATTDPRTIRRAAWTAARVRIPKRNGCIPASLPRPARAQVLEVVPSTERFVCQACGKMIRLGHNCNSLDRYRHEGKEVCAACHEMYVQRSRARMAIRGSDEYGERAGVRHCGANFWGAQ